MNTPCSACGDGDTAMKYHSHDIRDPRITTQQGRFSDEQLYTLSEVEELAREYADESDASNDLIKHEAIKYRLYLGAFIAYLKRREMEEGGR